MKLATFKELKDGDVVTLRTPKELQELKAYTASGLKDDNGHVWSSLVNRGIASGETATVVRGFSKECIDIIVEQENGDRFFVIRQSLR